MAEPKKPTDWERIELDYRAGLLSVREIAATNGVSHTAIQKRAKAESWDRDLGAKIKAKADALVAKREVAKQVAVATEQAVVEANAEAIARVRMAHRADIYRSRQLVMMLLTELEEVTTQRDEYHQLAEVLRDPDADRSRLEAAFEKALSLPMRTKTAKDLSDALKTLIGLEREAYSIVAEPAKMELTGKDGEPLMSAADPIEAAKMYQDLMK